MKWTQVLFGVGLGVVGVGLLVAGALDPGQRTALLIAGGILAAVGAFNFWLFRFIGGLTKGFPQSTMSQGDLMRDSVNRMNAMAELLRQQTLTQALQMNGRDAKAEVLAIRDTHKMVSFDPVLELDLLVSDGVRAPFRVTCSQVVSKIFVGRIAVGQTYAARVDPENTARVFVAWS